MKRLLTVGLVVGSTLPLYAAEEGAALSPFAGDFGNMLWTLVIFLIVVVLLGKFAWGPVLGLLKEREQFIHNSLSQAKHDREEAEARLKDYTAKLQAAQLEAGRIIEEARRDAEVFRNELRTKAKAEAESLTKNAEKQIQLQTDRAVQQIRAEAVDLSVMIASKLLQRNLSKEDNDRLIQEALKQVDSRSH